ncbi:ABC transporter permease [Caballeronia choica]|uniref:ABC transporter permease n=1 Tax=Caballeronia choica TaxID=326476 RepID=A0A158KZC9_9BURK|nr:ABC transporter permease [Caballeronia choica]
MARFTFLGATETALFHRDEQPPVFAFLIACIGCLEGLRVEGSAQSVGEHTTSSVVQSIFVVILLDAIAALFFLEMGLVNHYHQNERHESVVEVHDLSNCFGTQIVHKNT